MPFNMKGLGDWTKRRHKRILKLEKKVGIKPTGEIVKPKVKKGGRRFEKITKEKLPKLYGKQYPGEEYVSPFKKAPPGMEKEVKAFKKDPNIDNPWALAWSIYNKKK